MKRRFAVLAVAIAATVALAGCTGSRQAAAPSPSASASTEPQPTTEPTPLGAIVIGPDSLQITGSAPASFPYSAPATTAIASLTDLLGTPASSVYVPPAKCTGGTTTVTWSTLTLDFVGDTAASSPSFQVQTKVKPGVVDITSPNGGRVGDPWAAYFATVSAHPNRADEYQGVTYRRVVDAAGTEAPTFGTIVTAQDDTITSIERSDLNADC